MHAGFPMPVYEPTKCNVIDHSILILVLNGATTATTQFSANYNTVKPLMFACPLFRKFCKLNKTEKLKSVNVISHLL